MTRRLVRSTLLVALGLSASVVQAQAPESTWGWEPGVPQQMTGEAPGAVIASGVLGGTDHGWADGYVVISRTTVMLPLDSIGWPHLRRFKGQTVDLVVRPVTPRQLKQVERE